MDAELLKVSSLNAAVKKVQEEKRTVVSRQLSRAPFLNIQNDFIHSMLINGDMLNTIPGRDVYSARYNAINGSLMNDAYSSAYNQCNMVAITTAAYLIGTLGLCPPQRRDPTNLKNILWPPLPGSAQGGTSAAFDVYWSFCMNKFMGTPIVQPPTLAVPKLRFVNHVQQIAAVTFWFMYKFAFLNKGDGVVQGDTPGNRAAFVTQYAQLQSTLFNMFGNGVPDFDSDTANPMNQLESIYKLTSTKPGDTSSYLDARSRHVHFTSESIKYIQTAAAQTSEDDHVNRLDWEAIASSVSEQDDFPGNYDVRTNGFYPDMVQHNNTSNAMDDAGDSPPENAALDALNQLYKYMPRPIYDYLRFSCLLADTEITVENDPFMSDCAEVDETPACYKKKGDGDDEDMYWKYHYNVCAKWYQWETVNATSGIFDTIGTANVEAESTFPGFGRLLWCMRMASSFVSMCREADLAPDKLFVRLETVLLGNQHGRLQVRAPSVAFGHVLLDRYADPFPGPPVDTTRDEPTHRTKLVPELVRSMYLMSGDADDMLKLVAKMAATTTGEGASGEAGITGVAEYGGSEEIDLLKRMIFAKRVISDTIGGQLLGLTEGTVSSNQNVSAWGRPGGGLAQQADDQERALHSYENTIKSSLRSPKTKSISKEFHSELLENLAIGCFTDRADIAFSHFTTALVPNVVSMPAGLSDSLLDSNLSSILRPYASCSPTGIREHVRELTQGIGSVMRMSLRLKLAIIQDFLVQEFGVAESSSDSSPAGDYARTIAKITESLKDVRCPFDYADSDDDTIPPIPLEPKHRLWAIKRVWDAIHGSAGGGGGGRSPPWKILACLERFGHFRGDSPIVVLGRAVSNIATQRVHYRIATDMSNFNTATSQTSSDIFSSGVSGLGRTTLESTYRALDHIFAGSASYSEEFARVGDTHGKVLFEICYFLKGVSATSQIMDWRGNHPVKTRVFGPMGEAVFARAIDAFFASAAQSGVVVPQAPSTRIEFNMLATFFMPHLVAYVHAHWSPYRLASIFQQMNPTNGSIGGRAQDQVFALPEIIQFQWEGLLLDAAKADERKDGEGGGGSGGETRGAFAIGVPENVFTSADPMNPVLVFEPRTDNIGGIGSVMPKSMTGFGHMLMGTSIDNSKYEDPVEILQSTLAYNMDRVARARNTFQTGGDYERALSVIIDHINSKVARKAQGIAEEYDRAATTFANSPEYRAWRYIRESVYDSVNSGYARNPRGVVAAERTKSSVLDALYGPARKAVEAAAKRLTEMYEPSDASGATKGTACTGPSAGKDKAASFVQQKFIGAHVSPAQPSPGMLLWHSAGSGKTICGVEAVNNFIYGPPQAARDPLHPDAPIAKWNVIWVLPDETQMQQLILDMYKYADRFRVSDKLVEEAKQPNGVVPHFGKTFLRKWRKNVVSNGSAGSESLNYSASSPTVSELPLDPSEIAKRLILTYKEFAKFINAVNAELQTGADYPDKAAASIYLRRDMYTNETSDVVTDVLRETIVVFDEFQNLFKENGPHATNLTQNVRIGFMRLLDDSRMKSGPLACKLLAFSATPEGTYVEKTGNSSSYNLSEDEGGTKDILARMLQMIHGPVPTRIVRNIGQEDNGSSLGALAKYTHIYPILADATLPLVPDDIDDLKDRFSSTDRIVLAIFKEEAASLSFDRGKLLKRLQEEFIRRYITPCVSYFDATGSPLLMPQIRVSRDSVTELGPMSSLVMVSALDTSGAAMSAFANVLRTNKLDQTVMYKKIPGIDDKLKNLAPDADRARRIAAYKKRTLAS